MTAMTLWQPFRELTSLSEQVDQVFRNVFPEVESLERSLLASSSLIPKADIYEENDQIVLELEAPGMREEDLKITLEGDALTISGERKSSHDGKEGRFQRMERSYGSFSRSFTLPSTVNAQSVQAKYENGVLQLVMQKKPEAQPRQIPVNGRNLEAKQITANAA